MSNAEANKRLDDWIRNLQSFDQMGPEAAKTLVPTVRTETSNTIRSQQSLDGTPWAPTKAGTPALVNAMQHIVVRAVNTVILIQMRGHEVFHQFGFRGTPARPILPVRGMPKKLGNAIRLGIVDMGVEWMTRSGRHGKRAR